MEKKNKVPHRVRVHEFKFAHGKKNIQRMMRGELLNPRRVTGARTSGGVPQNEIKWDTVFLDDVTAMTLCSTISCQAEQAVRMLHMDKLDRFDSIPIDKDGFMKNPFVDNFLKTAYTGRVYEMDPNDYLSACGTVAPILPHHKSSARCVEDHHNVTMSRIRNSKSKIKKSGAKEVVSRGRRRTRQRSPERSPERSVEIDKEKLNNNIKNRQSRSVLDTVQNNVSQECCFFMVKPVTALLFAMAASFSAIHLTQSINYALENSAATMSGEGTKHGEGALLTQGNDLMSDISDQLLFQNPDHIVYENLWKNATHANNSRSFLDGFKYTDPGDPTSKYKIDGTVKTRNIISAQINGAYYVQDEGDVAAVLSLNIPQKELMQRCLGNNKDFAENDIGKILIKSTSLNDFTQKYINMQTAKGHFHIHKDYKIAAQLHNVYRHGARIFLTQTNPDKAIDENRVEEISQMFMNNINLKLEVEKDNSEYVPILLEAVCDDYFIPCHSRKASGKVNETDKDDDGDEEMKENSLTSKVIQGALLFGTAGAWWMGALNTYQVANIMASSAAMSMSIQNTCERFVEFKNMNKFYKKEGKGWLDPEYFSDVSKITLEGCLDIVSLYTSFTLGANCISRGRNKLLHELKPMINPFAKPLMAQIGKKAIKFIYDKGPKTEYQKSIEKREEEAWKELPINGILDNYLLLNSARERIAAWEYMKQHHPSLFPTYKWLIENGKSPQNQAMLFFCSAGANSYVDVLFAKNDSQTSRNMKDAFQAAVLGSSFFNDFVNLGTEYKNLLINKGKLAIENKNIKQLEDGKKYQQEQARKAAGKSKKRAVVSLSDLSSDEDDSE